jgi:hypothetical protein
MFTTFQQTNHQEGKKKNYVSLRVTVKQRDSHRSSTSTLLLLEHQRGRKMHFCVASLTSRYHDESCLWLQQEKGRLE